MAVVEVSEHGRSIAPRGLVRCAVVRSSGTLLGTDPLAGRTGFFDTDTGLGTA